jgi:hypothetical protein
MSTLLTIAFFAALALILWIGAAQATRSTRFALRLYGTLLFTVLAAGALVSVTATWLIVGAGVLLFAIQFKRSLS